MVPLTTDHKNIEATSSDRADSTHVVSALICVGIGLRFVIAPSMEPLSSLCSCDDEVSMTLWVPMSEVIGIY